MPAPRTARHLRRQVQPLSTDAVVAVALRLARTDGLAAVTMRAVADELDTGAMSLYRYVADRHALLLAMLDEVATGVTAVLDRLNTGDSPRERITAIISALHDGFRADPWIVPVIATDGLSSPRILPLLDTLIGALFAAGLDEQQTVEGYSLLFQFTYGEAIDRHRDRATYGQQMVRAADPAVFVHIGRILAAVPAGGIRDHFDVNLARLLDGLLDRPHE